MATQLSDSEMSKNPYKTIAKLAWPQIIMMLFHFMIGFVDVWVAGQINREVQATLGLITQVLFFFLVVGQAISNGAIASIAQSLGAKKHSRARHYVGLCILLATGAATLMALFIAPFKSSFIKALQVPLPLQEICEYFIEIYLYMLPAYYLLIITNAVFRAKKEVIYPLYSMILVMVINTIGDLGLGLGMWGMPNMGYKGLAWATFGSIIAGTLFNIVMLIKTGTICKGCFPPVRWVKAAMPYLLKVAWPSGLMQVVWHSGYMVLYAIVGSLASGSVIALAGMATGIRIESILFLPAFAFNMTASILVGHYLGAGKPEEAKSFGFKVWAVGCLFTSGIALALWPFLDIVVSFIAHDAAVEKEAMSYLFFNVLAIPFTFTTMTLAGALGGAGATLYNFFIMGLATWFLRLPLAYILGHEIMNSSEGIWISMLASQFLQAALALYIYSFKNWERFSMIKKRKAQAE
ncbi:MAG: MATE family efflux transporter [Desulfovibrio sp.]